MPKVFVIEAASQEAHELAEERYAIRTKLSHNQWTVAPADTMRIYGVRWFLNDNGVNDKDMAFAIEELSRRTGIHAHSWSSVSSPARHLIFKIAAASHFCGDFCCLSRREYAIDQRKQHAILKMNMRTVHGQ